MIDTDQFNTAVDKLIKEKTVTVMITEKDPDKLISRFKDEIDKILAEENILFIEGQQPELSDYGKMLLLYED